MDSTSTKETAQGDTGVGVQRFRTQPYPLLVYKMRFFTFECKTFQIVLHDIDGMAEERHALTNTKIRPQNFMASSSRLVARKLDGISPTV